MRSLELIKKKGFLFSGQCSGYGKSSTGFVYASDSKDKSEEIATFSGVNYFHHKTTQKPSRRWICHFCGRFSHIRPFCYKLHGYSNKRYYGNTNRKNFAPIDSKTKWRVKRSENLNKCNVAFTSVYASSQKTDISIVGIPDMTGNSTFFLIIQRT